MRIPETVDKEKEKSREKLAENGTYRTPAHQGDISSGRLGAQTSERADSNGVARQKLSTEKS